MTPKLIKTIAEVQQTVPVAMTSVFSVLSPFLYTAERTYIKLLIGNDQYEALAAAFEADTTDEDLVKAIKLAQRIIANLGYLNGLAILGVSLTGSGIQINSSADVKNAFQWQVEDVKDSLQELGFDALEEFLEFLEDNPEKFSGYIASDEYKAQQASLITTAADFTKYYDINGSRYIFQRILSIMRRIESQSLVRVFGAVFYRSLAGETATGKTKILVEEYLKPGLALLTASKAFVERVITLEGGKVAFNFRGNYNNIKESQAATRDQVKETREQLDKDGADFISSGMEYLLANLGDFEDFVPQEVKRRARGTNTPDKGIFGV
jgi:hypothetical protein